MVKKMIRKRTIVAAFAVSLLLSYMSVQINNACLSVTVNQPSEPYPEKAKVYQNYKKSLIDNKQPETVSTKENKVQQSPIPKIGTETASEEAVAEEEIKMKPEDEAYLKYREEYLVDQKVKFNSTCGDYVGINVIKDYNNKIFIIKVANDSSAKESGINVGDQILKINNKKYKKFKKKNTEQIMNMINAQAKVNLVVKTISGNKRAVSLNKSNFCVTQKEDDELYSSYWLQIYPENIDISEGISNLKSISFIPFTYRLNNEINRNLSYLEYWKKKEQTFKNQYKACVISNYTNKSFHDCVASNVTRDLEEIWHEETIAMERAKMESQERMQKMGVYASIFNSMAILDHANALRNQHVNHSGVINHNVQHSGTVNVNSNVNLRGQIWHY